MSELIFRQCDIDVTRMSDENRTVEASFSSEHPVERYYGNEVLVHSPQSVDLSRAPLPLLVSHDSNQPPVGVAESLHVSSGKLRGTLRFSKGQRAKELWDDIKQGILRSISIGYRVIDADDAGDTFQVTRWQPLEVSLVSVPADPTVGIGRSYSPKGENMTTENETQSRSERRNSKQTAVAERERILGIERAAESYADGSSSDSFKRAAQSYARQLIEEGGTPAQFRHWAKDQMPPAPDNMQRDADIDIGLSRSEVDKFSFVRAIRSQIDPKFAMREGGFELEVSHAVSRQLGREPQGLFVPDEVLRRDLNAGTATAGGNTVATDLLASSFIELLRNKMRIIELGATQLHDLNGNVAIPRQTGPTTAYWVAEAGAPTESEPTFDQVTMTPKTVGAFTDFTRKLMLQSSIDIEAFVRGDLATVLALEIDRVAINGSGSGNEPEGILNTTGIGLVSIGTDGGAPTWDHVVNMEAELTQDNADQSALAYLTNSKVVSKMKRTFIDSGSGERLWDIRNNERPLNGYRALVSNQMPSNLTKGTGTNLSAILFGSWNNLLIGRWGGLDLLVDPYTHSTTGTVRVVALQDIDVAVRHAESFAAIVDAVTT